MIPKSVSRLREAKLAAGAHVQRFGGRSQVGKDHAQGKIHRKIEKGSPNVGTPLEFGCGGRICSRTYQVEAEAIGLKIGCGGSQPS
jgi:hypothetical protein